MRKIKTELTEEEFHEIKNLLCEATLCKDAEHKQWYLLEIAGIMAGSKIRFIDSAENAGYNISRGINPNKK